MPSDLHISRNLSIWTLVQIAAVLVTMTFFFAKQDARLSEIERRVTDAQTRTDRIEKYLSSRDSEYWQRVKHIEDSEISQFH